MFPNELGEFIACDTEMLEEIRWELFTVARWGRIDFASLVGLHCPARCLIYHYKHCGAPVDLARKRWTEGQRAAALEMGPQNSTDKHAPFLHGKFSDMTNKGQWVVLPYPAPSSSRDLG